MEFPEGGRGIVCGPFLENPGGWGGSYEKSLPWGGYGYFLEPHIVFATMPMDQQKYASHMSKRVIMLLIWPYSKSNLLHKNNVIVFSSSK